LLVLPLFVRRFWESPSLTPLALSRGEKKEGGGREKEEGRGRQSARVRHANVVRLTRFQSDPDVAAS